MHHHMQNPTHQLQGQYKNPNSDIHSTTTYSVSHFIHRLIRPDFIMHAFACCAIVLVALTCVTFAQENLSSPSGRFMPTSPRPHGPGHHHGNGSHGNWTHGNKTHHNKKPQVIIAVMPMPMENSNSSDPESLGPMKAVRGGGSGGGQQQDMSWMMPFLMNSNGGGGGAAGGGRQDAGAGGGGGGGNNNMAAMMAMMAAKQNQGGRGSG